MRWICIAALVALGCAHAPGTSEPGPAVSIEPGVELASGRVPDAILVHAHGRDWPIQDRALIGAVEARLAAAGYDPGRTDGKVGPQLGLALSRFQADRGLPSTGTLDQDTAHALGMRWRRVSAGVRAMRLEPLAAHR